jgi:hypothetical protein
MKAISRCAIAVICPFLVFGLLVAVPGCGGGDGEQAADVEEQAEEVREEAKDVAEHAESEMEEHAAEAEEVGHYIAGFACPMHPAESYLEEGTCEVCGMKLERANLYYTCTMCPGVHAHEAGKCPKCGMELVLRPVTEAPQKEKEDY